LLRNDKKNAIRNQENKNRIKNKISTNYFCFGAAANVTYFRHFFMGYPYPAAGGLDAISLRASVPENHRFHESPEAVGSDNAIGFLGAARAETEGGAGSKGPAKRKRQIPRAFAKSQTHPPTGRFLVRSWG
jgi:hypothetical protein